MPAQTSAAAPKFGYVMPEAQYALMQPALDRYAGQLRERVSSSSEPVDFVTLKGGREVETPEACRKYGLAGFFRPNRRWRIEDDSVDVTASLTVTGCDGTMFYYGDVRRDFERDRTQEPQKQVDAATAEAITALASNFAAFQRTHAADWKKLLSTAQSSPAV